MTTPPSYVSQHDEDAKVHSVISFLKRPQIIKTGTIQGAARDVILQTITVPDDMMTKMITDKLDGFTSFSATAVLRVQVQSQPFMAGRLLLCSIPTPTLLGNRTEYTLARCSRTTLLNHVQIDISKDSEGELRVPFISPYNTYDLISSRWPWARVSLQVYSPVNTVGNFPVDYVIYGHFEDIRLGAPTSGAMGAYKLQGPGIKPSGETQSRMRAREAEPSTSGKISGIAKGVGDVSSIVGSLLPFLSPVTKVISGVAGGVGSVIETLGSLFGFSKPIVNQQTIDINQRTVSNFSNINFNDNSHVLSMDKTNVISPIEGLGGTKVDEMSFDYLKKIPQFLFNFDYKMTNKIGDILFTVPVHPCYRTPDSISLKRTVTDVRPRWAYKYALSSRQPSHLYYISSIAKYWSGSLVYTFKFVKTDFHSGRVEISFHPFTDAGSDSVSDYVYRVIVDLREKSEVSVVVPFFSVSPMKRMLLSSISFDSKYSDIAYYATGTLTVKSLTPLKYSSVVSNTIECLVEVSAGEDFYVSSILSSQFTPLTIDIQNPAPVYSLQSGHSAAYQENPRQQAIASQPVSITNAESDIQQPNMSMELAGEIFQNFRSFIKRNAWVSYAGVPSSLAIRYLITPARIQYFILSLSKEGDAGFHNEGFYLEKRTTPLSYTSGMFAFYRGGVRVKTYNSSSTSSISASYTTKDEATNYRYIAFNSPRAIEQTNVKNIAEFQVPYYGISVFASHHFDKESFYFSRPRNRINIGSDTANNVTLAVSGADDFEFHCFIGTPPCLDTLSLQDYTNLTTSSSSGQSYNATAYGVRTSNGYNLADPFIKYMNGIGSGAQWELETSVPKIQSAYINDITY